MIQVIICITFRSPSVYSVQKSDESIAFLPFDKLSLLSPFSNLFFHRAIIEQEVCSHVCISDSPAVSTAAVSISCGNYHAALYHYSISKIRIDTTDSCSDRVFLYILSAVCIFSRSASLPPMEEVASYTKPIMQLIPFASLKEFTMNSSLIWNDPATYLTALNEPSLYLIIFNILLTVPFGVYLRYYFQCSWKKTLLCTFLLTLSFECLQLSALFGYYPRPYRLFDVDDLITNTLGGMLGYAITPVFAHFLVSRSRMDEKAYDRGRSVSPLRRHWHFL